MVRRKEDFSKEHRLDDLSVVKLWGMAISSVKDLVATFTTVHPSQQPEYLIQSDYRTTLSVVPVDSQQNPAKFVTRILRENLSAETVAYSVKFWLKHLLDSPDKRKSTIQEILTALDQTILRIEQEPIENGEDSPTASLNTLLYHSKALKAHRMKRLISLFDLSLDPAAASNLDMVIIAKFTTTILRLPRASWKRSIISKYILLEYKKVTPKLQADSVHQAEDLDLSHRDMKEQCEICEAEIPLENLTWARCVEGHEFGMIDLPGLADLAFHIPC
jgi:Putative zinc-finger of transcription factor IIIC complex